MTDSDWKRLDTPDKKQVWQDGRFKAMTWVFGTIYQCKVFIQYDHMIEGKKHISPGFNDELAISLTPGKTREEAAKRALDWIDTFKKRRILSSNKLFKKCQKNYPDLFPNRISILEHLFFTGGNGYAWLDGCIFELNPSDHLALKVNKEDKELDDIVARIKESGKEARKLLGLLEPEDNELDDEESYRKKKAEADKHMFYSISKEYANICQVPDDVQTHWLKISYEAAILLRDKSGVPDIKSKHHKPTERDVAQQARNSKIGADIVAELERRFPHVKKDQQVSTEEA